MSRGTKSTEFLKECMADALLKLMQSTPIEKITVPQIVAEAGVGRTTWFRHFNTKSDAITYKLICLWERWVDEHHILRGMEFDINNAETFFEFNLSIRYLHDIIYSKGQHSAVYNAFYTVMVRENGSNAPECYVNRFFSSGLFGLLDEWIKRGYHETPQELAKLLPQFISSR